MTNQVTSLPDTNKPFDMVIFGGLGDLSRRKLIPAMFRAMCQGEMPKGSRLILCSRSAMTKDELIEKVDAALNRYLKSHECVKADLQAFYEMVSPMQLDLLDLKKGWDHFKEVMDEHDRVRVYYLAVIPSAYGPCCKNLSKTKLITKDTRLVVEKPIGYSLPTAEGINEIMAKYFDESQIYRIDHYLGKDAVQNLLTLRFSNFIFEDVWDNKSIDSIQISITEQVGLEGRADFYDDVGALRDMVQNHLLQLLCLIALDSPNEMCSDAVRFEKVKVLKALKPILGEDVDKKAVRGQYVSGMVGKGSVKGYLDELGNYDSKTETYAAIKAEIENWRWAGVPFYLRTGKCLKEKSAEIIVQFKDVTHNVYSGMGQVIQPNQLIIKLQPKEKVQLKLNANDIGGGSSTIKPILLNLDFESDDKLIRTDYQRLLMDAVKGNSTLFIHRDEVIAAWTWIDPIVEYWANSKSSPKLYSAGSWGPGSADDIFDHEHQHWFEQGKDDD